MTKRLFTTISALAYTGCCRALPDPLRPQDRASPAPHGSTRCYRRKNGPQRQNRRAGGVERSPLGDGLLSPRDTGKGADPRKERGLQHFRRRFPPGIFCRVPFGVSILRKEFFPGDGTWSSPGEFFSYPRVFWRSGRASDSLSTSQCFESRLLLSISCCCCFRLGFSLV